MGRVGVRAWAGLGLGVGRAGLPTLRQRRPLESLSLEPLKRSPLPTHLVRVRVRVRARVRARATDRAWVWAWVWVWVRVWVRVRVKVKLTTGPSSTPSSGAAATWG